MLDSCETKKETESEIQQPIPVKPESKGVKDQDLLKTADKFIRNKEIPEAAKGAVIGAAAGALTGAAVSKNDRAKGAIVGGAVGAGAGALTGAAIDKKQKDGKLFKKGLFKKKKNNNAPDEN